MIGISVQNKNISYDMNIKIMKDIPITLSDLWLELFFTSLTKEPTKCDK